MNAARNTLSGAFLGGIALGILVVVGQTPIPRWALYTIVTAVAVWAALLILEHGILKPRRHAEDDEDAAEDRAESAAEEVQAAR